MLRLLRGAGITGLGGMKPETCFDDMTIIRPWLDIRRSVIDEYRETCSVPCCHDSSNDAVHHDRNWIRHVVFPQFNERFGPDITERLLRTAHIHRAVAEYMHHAAHECIAEHARVSFAGTAFPLECFNACHIGLQREITRQLISASAADHVQAGFDMIESVRAYLTGSERNCPACLPGEMCISKAFGHALVTTAAIQPVTPSGFTPGVPREIIPGITVLIDPVQEKGIPYSDNGEGWAEAVLGEQVELVQYASVPDKSTCGIRPRMPGDRYRPVNGSEKKIKDLMINAGIPNSIKETIPVVTVDGKPAWLAGWRIAENYKAQTGHPVYRLSCRINYT
jgi:tRNA(Ile)-lysidine synthase